MLLLSKVKEQCWLRKYHSEVASHLQILPNNKTGSGTEDMSLRWANEAWELTIYLPISQNLHIHHLESHSGCAFNKRPAMHTMCDATTNSLTRGACHRHTS